MESLEQWQYYKPVNNKNDASKGKLDQKYLRGWCQY